MNRFMFTLLMMVALAPVAIAGTTTIGFTVGLGPLANGSNANLTTIGDQACFSGSNTTLLGASGAINASGTIVMQMTLQPSNANPTIGFTLVGNGGTSLTAVTDANGDVTISNSLGDSDTTFFSFPNATNNFMRLEYNTGTDIATVFVPGSSGGERSAMLNLALDGATGYQLGVVSGGTGCFDDFSATGPSIPNYSDPAEIVVDFPLSGSQQSPVVSSIATGCGTATLSADESTLTVHIEHGVYQATDAHIHLGAVGVNGGVIIPFASAGSPIDQVINVTAQNVADFLAGNLYANIHSVSHPGGEIRGQIVDNQAVCNVTVDNGPNDADQDGTPDLNDAFPNNAYGQTDTDNDGLGDEWENFYFGDLITTDEFSDYDNDSVSDLIEFQYAHLGYLPIDGNSQGVPVVGGAGLVALALVLLRTGGKK